MCFLTQFNEKISEKTILYKVTSSLRREEFCFQLMKEEADYIDIKRMK